jgi:hypothetical protein
MWRRTWFIQDNLKSVSELSGIIIIIIILLYSPLFGLGRVFSFLVLYTVSRTTWTGDQSVSRPPPTHKTIQKQNKRTRTSMPRVGFEPTIPEFERAKTVYTLDRTATVIGIIWYYNHK